MEKLNEKKLRKINAGVEPATIAAITGAYVGICALAYKMGRDDGRNERLREEREKEERKEKVDGVTGSAPSIP